MLCDHAVTFRAKKKLLKTMDEKDFICQGQEPVLKPEALGKFWAPWAIFTALQDKLRDNIQRELVEAQAIRLSSLPSELDAINCLVVKSHGSRRASNCHGEAKLESSQFKLQVGDESRHAMFWASASFQQASPGTDPASFETEGMIWKGEIPRMSYNIIQCSNLIAVFLVGVGRKQRLCKRRSVLRFKKTGAPVLIQIILELPFNFCNSVPGKKSCYLRTKQMGEYPT